MVNGVSRIERYLAGFASCRREYLADCSPAYSPRPKPERLVASLSLAIAGLKGSLSIRSFRNALLETLLTTAALFIIAIGASMLTRFLAFSGAGNYLSQVVAAMGANELLLLLGISLIYLVLGMFLEPLGAMLLTLPILLPIVESTGFSLVWFGVLLTKFLEIGMITPPIGLNVFVIKGVVGNLASTTTIFRGIMWFLVADVFVVMLLIAFPQNHALSAQPPGLRTANPRSTSARGPTVGRRKETVRNDRAGPRCRGRRRGFWRHVSAAQLSPDGIARTGL